MTLSEVATLAENWTKHCDRGAKSVATKMKHGVEHLNDMQAAGLGIAKLLWKGEYPELKVEIQEFTGGKNSMIAFEPTWVHSMSLQQLQATLATLQLQFHKQYQPQQHFIIQRIDMNVLLLAFLARLGFFLAHDFDPPADAGWSGAPTNSEQVDAWSAPAADGGVAAEAQRVRQPASLELDPPDPDTLPATAADVWHPERVCLRVATACRILDAVHSMLCLHALLGRARVSRPWTPAEPESTGGIEPYHREAGLDTYNELILYTSCPVGTITQYMHRFNHLFHSVSQVVYYNFPDFRRPAQKSFDDVVKPNAPAVNLLPALLELEPIPVLYEHTGAGHAATHAQHPRAWVVWDQFVLLIDRQMNVHYASDLRALATNASPSSIDFSRIE